LPILIIDMLKIKEKDNIGNVLALLTQDSQFAGRDSGYVSHNFHAFAAKFPPQLPRLFIEHLTNPLDLVLDPMVGSGTTVVEAMLAGRKGVGYDIDHLALHLARIKTSGIELGRVRNFINKVVSSSINYYQNKELIESKLAETFDKKTKEFIEYWFLPATTCELMALTLAINEITDDSVKDFFKLVFSSIIITKSGGVSLARDLAHSRPHKDKSKRPKNAIEAFGARLNKLMPGLNQIPRGGDLIKIERQDARRLPLPDNSVDLIVTSPPYANAIDYMRAHKFSLVWFGHPISELTELRAKYIGSERAAGINESDLPEYCSQTIADLVEIDKPKARVVAKYFNEMKLVIGEMHRVLKSNKYCIVVVGNSTVRGYLVQTNKHLEELGRSVGFDIVANMAREIDRNKRMMPISFNSGRNGIEHRMHEEYILIFGKL
jgi:DNA modification methylase